MSASVEESPGASPGAGSGPRGRVWVCALAFAMLLVSTYLQFSGAIGTGGLTVVWSSIGLSAAAAFVALAAVLLPGNAARPKTDASDATDRAVSDAGSEARDVPASRSGAAAGRTSRTDPGDDGETASSGEEPKPR